MKKGLTRLINAGVDPDELETYLEEVDNESLEEKHKHLAARALNKERRKKKYGQSRGKPEPIREADADI